MKKVIATLTVGLFASAAFAQAPTPAPAPAAPVAKAEVKVETKVETNTVVKAAGKDIKTAAASQDIKPAAPAATPAAQPVTK